MKDNTFTLSQQDVEASDAMRSVREMIAQYGYELVETNETKPWGAYYRLADSDAERFIQEFFPGLTLEEAQMGIPGAPLSPKFLLVAPGQRLSWQYHDRRAERWRFLTSGAYYKSSTDEQGERVSVQAGDVVQFECAERHRLCADDKAFTLVAEIWQHTSSQEPSDEADIVRLQDDYSR